jgi:predicted RNA-binding protein with PIN domain
LRTLIDGYNVMFAAGLMGRRFGPDGFRKTRHRFLNDLAAKIGPVEAHLTTVVFDAKKVPEGLPSETRHKGIAVLFAVDSPTADERIDELIRSHSDPKRLTVVSSDNQVRAAAKRRRATAVSADDFLSRLEEGTRRRAEEPTNPQPEKPTALSDSESAYWVEQFGEIERSGELKRAFDRDSIFPSDEEIAQIEAEVEREFREGK